MIKLKLLKYIKPGKFILMTENNFLVNKINIISIYYINNANYRLNLSHLLH
jgi:hypothetical protein